MGSAVAVVARGTAAVTLPSRARATAPEIPRERITAGRCAGQASARWRTGIEVTGAVDVAARDL